MAKIGNNYSAEYENTEKQGGSFELLPHMYALIEAESIELKDTKDNLGWQSAIAFQVIEPAEYAGKKFFEYWTIIHPDGYQNGSYKYGKPNFDRFGRAVGVEITADTDTDDLTFKSFVAEITINAGGPKPGGGNYSDRNRIGRFFYPDADAKDPIPELGVIDDGNKTPPPANDSRAASRPAAAQQAAAAKPAGGRPWGQKRAA